MKSRTPRSLRRVDSNLRTLIPSALLILVVGICAQAQSEDREKCAKSIEHTRIYSSYNDSIFKHRWHILIVPPDLDQKCLVVLVTELHRQTPNDKYEFFNAESKELDKYITYNRDNPRARYSMEWVNKHSVGTLQTEADPPHCATWVLKVNLEVVTKLDRFKCPLDP